VLVARSIVWRGAVAVSRVEEEVGLVRSPVCLEGGRKVVVSMYVLPDRIGIVLYFWETGRCRNAGR